MSITRFKKRVDKFFEKRYYKIWKGEPITRNSRNPGPDDIILQSNDYLCLAKNIEAIASQIAELKRGGSGPQMSGVFIFDDEHIVRRLEAKFAAFLNMSGALLSQSGYNANVGLVQSIADSKTIVYIDRFAHTSLWEGIRSAGARAFTFRHNDADSLQKQVREHGPGVILFDSIYSTDGSVGPLPDIASIGKQNECLVVVDESHSLGTHGPEGRGIVNQENLCDDVDFITASLAKAFAARAGIIASRDKRHVEYLRFEHRPAIFSSVVEPHEARRISRTIDLIKRDEFKRLQLASNAAYLRKSLRDLGYIVKSESHIVSIVCGSEAHCRIVKKFAESKGLFGSVFVFPATPKNQSLIRYSVNCDMTQEQLDVMVRILSETRANFF